MRHLHSVLVILCLHLAGSALGAERLGRVDFPNSGAPEAQDAFMRAVLLLHSFEYEDAREAFREAQRIDPDFALAYWGEAMTHNHPLWREQDRDAALTALAKLAPTSAARRARVPTERERAYLAALELLFANNQGNSDKLDRDVAYSEAMCELADRYPDDLEARSFCALSILGIAQGERDFRIYMRAGAVAEEVFAVNPLHPGAVHYLIHSYDDPIHAPLGLRAARVYAEIAPAASHAQHMISHIFVALGRWDESVDANVKSFDVSAARREAKGLDVDALNYHSLHWLEYSYLQLGRLDEARRMLESMTRYARESGSPRALWYHAAMRAAWIVESGGGAAPPEIAVEETQVTGAAANLFADGYAAWLAGDREGVERAATRISARHEAAAHGPLCHQSGDSFMDTSKGDLIVAGVMQDSLRGLIALDRGQTGKALALFDSATAAEESLPLAFGPPTIVKPSHELYGEVLLRLDRPADARIQFDKALERAPRRSLALAGLARASRASGDDDSARSACAELAASYVRADESMARPEACSATSTVGRR